jgi:hypothetical protein
MLAWICDMFISPHMLVRLELGNNEIHVLLKQTTQNAQ